MKEEILKKLMKTKTNFNQMSKRIYEFEKQAGFTETSEKRLVKALKNEIKEYEEAKTKLRQRNKLMDIIILSIQISRRKNMSLEEAWVRWWKKSAKYLGKHKAEYRKKFDEEKRH